MRHTKLASVDLNLLVVLDELLRCRSTVKAAEKLGRTQPSVSHALGRLRDVFGDPLFVRAGAALSPTTFAEELEGPLREALASFEELITPQGPIDPSRLSRTFTISAADFAEVVVLPRLMQRLRVEAPDVDIIVRFTGAAVDRVVQAGEIDLALGTSFQPLSGLVMQRLFQDRLVCVVRHDNPHFGERLTLDEYLAAHHVLVAPRGLPGSLVDDALSGLGKRRRVVLRTPHFTAAVLAVARSDMIVTVPESFVRATQDLLPVRVLEPPLDVPALSFACIYAATRQKDPAHVWLRSRILDVCRDIKSQPT